MWTIGKNPEMRRAARHRHDVGLRNVENQVLSNDLTGGYVQRDRAGRSAAGQYSRDRVRPGRDVDVQELSGAERHLVGEDGPHGVGDRDGPGTGLAHDDLAVRHRTFDVRSARDEEPGDQFGGTRLHDRLTRRRPRIYRTTA